MTFTAHFFKHLFGPFRSMRLAQDFAFEADQLIATKDDGLGVLVSYAPGFIVCQKRAKPCRVHALALEHLFIEEGGLHAKFDTEILQLLAAVR